MLTIRQAIGAQTGTTSSLRSSGIVCRFVARLPLDVTAETWFLVLIYRLTSEQRIHGSSKICAGHGFSIAGAAVVELSPVHQLAILIEQIEIRSAGRGVALGDGLSFVVADREVEFPFGGHASQAFRRIVSGDAGIVGTDANNRYAFRRIVPPE